MTINRSDIIEAKLLKHRRWHDHTFGMLFKTTGKFQHRRRDFKDFFQSCARRTDKITAQ